MRRAAKIDANQPEIVDALRGAGCSVSVTSHVGRGFPDICVGTGGATFLLEIKDPSQPPSKRQLTDDQKMWHSGWAGHVCVVESVSDALRAVGVADD